MAVARSENTCECVSVCVRGVGGLERGSSPWHNAHEQHSMAQVSCLVGVCPAGSLRVGGTKRGGGDIGRDGKVLEFLIEATPGE